MNYPITSLDWPPSGHQCNVMGVADGLQYVRTG
jgi:hypothetical protein